MIYINLVPKLWLQIWSITILFFNYQPDTGVRQCTGLDKYM